MKTLISRRDRKPSGLKVPKRAAILKFDEISSLSSMHWPHNVSERHLTRFPNFKRNVKILVRFIFHKRMKKAKDLLWHLTELATKRSRQVFKEAVAENSDAQPLRPCSRRVHRNTKELRLDSSANCQVCFLYIFYSFSSENLKPFYKSLIFY